MIPDFIWWILGILGVLFTVAFAIGFIGAVLIGCNVLKLWDDLDGW